MGRITKKQAEQALKATAGKVFLAADRLGCSFQTIYGYMHRYPEIQALVDEERGKLVDTAEIALKRAVIDGEAWAVCFTLKTLGYKRGFIEHHEHEVRHAIDWDKLYNRNGNGDTLKAIEARFEDDDEEDDDENEELAQIVTDETQED